MAIGSDMVRVEVIDWNDFRSYSSTHKVSAVPKTFINFGESFVGTETEASILGRVQRSGK